MSAKKAVTAPGPFPLAGRQARTGKSGGYIATVAGLGPNFARQRIKLRPFADRNGEKDLPLSRIVIVQAAVVGASGDCFGDEDKWLRHPRLAGEVAQFRWLDDTAVG